MSALHRIVHIENSVTISKAKTQKELANLPDEGAPAFAWSVRRGCCVHVADSLVMLSIHRHLNFERVALEHVCSPTSPVREVVRSRF